MEYSWIENVLTFSQKNTIPGENEECAEFVTPARQTISTYPPVQHLTLGSSGVKYV